MSPENLSSLFPDTLLSPTTSQNMMSLVSYIPVMLTLVSHISALNRAVFKMRFNVADELHRNVLREVINNQPKVLISDSKIDLPVSWDGINVDLGKNNHSNILPFIGQENLVETVTKELIHQLNEADHFHAGHSLKVCCLRLIGTGSMHGAGKTEISHVVYQCLQGLAPEDQEVVGVEVPSTSDLDCPYTLWSRYICQKPGMEGLLPLIDEDMAHTDLLEVTHRYLVDHNRMLYLHLDDFVPFNEKGPTSATKKDFYTCLNNMLLPILCTPRIFLYISGRMPYFDRVAAAHNSYESHYCNSFSAQQELLDRETIHAAMCKMFIPALDVDKQEARGAPIALSDALDAILSPRPAAASTAAPTLLQSGSRDLALRLHRLTGGVPRYVEIALRALLTTPALASPLFQHAPLAGTITASAAALLLDPLFERGGSVYRAIASAAEYFFRDTCRVLQQAGEEEEEHGERMAGLLLLALRPGRTYPLTDEHIEALQSASAERNSIYRSVKFKRIPRCVYDAEFWGFQREIDITNKSVGFVLPPAVLEGLSRFLRDTHVIPPADVPLVTENPTKASTEEAVRLALIFHRMVGSFAPHPNWLGEEEDSGSEVVASAVAAVAQATASNSPSDVDAATATAATSMYLSSLPEVTRIGRMRTVKEVHDAIFHKSGSKTKCPPELLGQFLATLPATGFFAFHASFWSASANFLVRNSEGISHVAVTGAEDVSIKMLWHALGKAATIQRGAPDLQHTLVLCVMQPDARAKAMREIGLLPTEGLISLLQARTGRERALGEKRALGKSALGVERKTARMGVKVPGQQLATGDDENADEEDDEIYQMRNIKHAIQLIREGRLRVKVLDDAECGRFFRYNAVVQRILKAT